MPAEEKDAVPLAVRWAIRPPGWPTFMAFGAASLWLLWLGTFPSFYYQIGFVLLVLVWFGALILILARTAIQALAVTASRSPEPDMRKLMQRWAAILGVLGLATILLAVKAPMRVCFLAARPGLEQLVEAQPPDRFAGLAEDVRVGPYTISAYSTNARRADGWDEDKRIVYYLADDLESAFIYSPGGIGDLAYNAGRKGHLLGDWYWMIED